MALIDDITWKKISTLIPPSEDQKSEARRIFKEYEEEGRLKYLNANLLELDLEIIADFFRRLSLLRSNASPHTRRRDSRWMSDADFVFFNIRAASKAEGGGDFISSTILLSSIRANAIHLAPFTAISSENVNHLISHSFINPTLVNSRLESLGVSPEKQLKLFVDAAHMMGYAIGFDQGYHVSFEATVLAHRPELFRWIKLEPFNNHLSFKGYSFKEMMDSEIQSQFIEEIKHCIKRAWPDGDIDYRMFRSVLEERGFYAVPVNTKKGSGAANYIVFDVEKEEPVFQNGSYQKKIAPFKFSNYNFNENKNKIFKDSAIYYSRIFKKWRDQFKFDFLYLDNVMSPSCDTSYEHEQDNRIAEEPCEEILEKTIRTAKSSRKRIGLMASGRLEKISPFGKIGFDMIMERTDIERQDLEFMKRNFFIHDFLIDYNTNNTPTLSIPYRISLADHDSDSFRQRVDLEHFCARFLGCGKARRPKYEMMGMNDGSAGFIDSLHKNHSLSWNEKNIELETYHYIEDLYELYESFIKNGEIVKRYLDDRYSWWIISDKSRKKLLIAIVSVENSALLPPPNFSIDYREYISEKKILPVVQHDFKQRFNELILVSGNEVTIEEVPYRGFALYGVG